MAKPAVIETRAEERDGRVFVVNVYEEQTCERAIADDDELQGDEISALHVFGVGGTIDHPFGSGRDWEHGHEWNGSSWEDMLAHDPWNDVVDDLDRDEAAVRADDLIAEIADGDERIEAFLEALSAGAHVAEACRISGLSRDRARHLLDHVRATMRHA